VTPTPDRELAEARACIDRGDENGALKHLDRARRGYVEQHDVAGLEHLFVLADVLDAANERLRDSRENLVYAIGQNIRAETRRAAQLSGKPWQDPYPDLQAPTSHTRISLTRGVKIAIGLGVALTIAAIVAFSVAVSSNFFWNRHWTFTAGHGHAGFQAARFFAVSVAALLINLAVLEALVTGASLGPLPAQAIAVAVAMPFNFLGNKLWTFA